MSHTPVPQAKTPFPQCLYRSEINPINNKSRTLPILNVVDKYGRAFHLSWISFFVAFLSWFAFPPLLHGSIRDDLHLTTAQIGNSNIIGLLATLLVRFGVGPMCDRYGPRWVMVGCLIAGAIPTAMTPLITNVNGLYAVRFFVGILGGTFVPCQVWTTQFFDKNIVGRANALAGGWGNAGGGVTFFVMPAVVASLQSRGLPLGLAWRIAFPACPLIIILAIASAVVLFGDDTPTGPWHMRHVHQGGRAVDVETLDMAFIRHEKFGDTSSNTLETSGSSTPPGTTNSKTKMPQIETEPDIQTGTIEMFDETPKDPSTRDFFKVALAPSTFLVALPYLCSFGAELAIEGVISNIYTQSAKASKLTWSESTAGNWAAMFGLLNVFTRPLGGYFSDILYRYFGINSKKWFIIFLGLMQGIFFIWIGLAPKLGVYSLIGSMAGLAIFMEAANGANFSLVPWIHPESNGIVSGITGGFGNLGGILYNLAFRFNGTDYHRAMWIIGVCCVGLHVAVSFIKVPKPATQVIH